MGARGEEQLAGRSKAQSGQGDDEDDEGECANECCWSTEAHAGKKGLTSAAYLTHPVWGAEHSNPAPSLTSAAAVYARADSRHDQGRRFESFC